MALPEWYESTLEHQVRMTPKTWEALQEHGVNESSELRLEFFYRAPGEEAANGLVEFLRSETDYEVVAGSQKKGMLAKRAWNVAGATQPTAVSLAILNEWVTWMVEAGAEHGPCEFDGWGAHAPSP
jgi:hypothetical protein